MYKRVDGGRQQAHCACRKQASQRNSDRRSHEPEQCRFRHKCDQHGAAARAESADGSDIGAPAHHRNRDRVVDEKGSDQQSNVAENAKIPSKGRKHAPISGGLAALRIQDDAGGQHRPQPLLPRVDIRLIRHLQKNSIHAAALARCQLRRGDIHHDCVSAYPGGVGDESAHRIVVNLIIDQQADSVPDLSPRRACNPDGVGIVDVVESISLAEVTSSFDCCRLFASATMSIPISGTASPVADHGCVILYARTDAKRIGHSRQSAHDCLRHSSGSRHLKIVVAGQRLHRRAERSRRGIARQVDRQHHRHTERDRGDHQQRSCAFAKRRPDDKSEKQ